MKSWQKVLLGCGVLFVLTMALGMVLLARWVASYGKEPKVFETMQQPGGVATRLTYHRSAEAVALSPDGTGIAWMSMIQSPIDAIGPMLRLGVSMRGTRDRQKVFEAVLKSGMLGQLSLMDSDGHNKRVLPAGPVIPGPTFPSWSSDGGKLAYTGLSGGSTPEDAQLDIWVYDIAAPKAWQATSGGGDIPLFSPDGEWLAYIRADLKKKSASAHLWACRSDGSDARQLTDIPTMPLPFAKDWSPDSKRLVFISYRKREGADSSTQTALHIVTGDGRNERELFGGPVSWVRWSAREGRILFARPADRGARTPGRFAYDLGMLPPAGGEPRWLVKNVLGRLSLGVYCPQGNAVVYPHKSSSGDMDLYLLDLSRGSSRRLTDCGDVSVAPGGVDASGDAREVIFVRWRRIGKGRRIRSVWKLEVAEPVVRERVGGQ